MPSVQRKTCDLHGNVPELGGPSDSVELFQTEEAKYRLDGLILVIEGIGRTNPAANPFYGFLG